MSTGLKANSDGSAAIQVGGTDVITLTSGGAATFVTSPTTVQAGTAAAPSITFSGDTNTGIYSPGADTVAISTAATERMRISASGQVTKPNQPAFLATRDSGNQTGLTTGSDLIFASEVYDEGSNYNASTGVFTAPVTGKYLFTCTALFTAITNGQEIDVGLVTSNRLYFFGNPGRLEVSTGVTFGDGYISYGISQIVDMDANDTAYCEISGLSSGTIALYSGATWTRFAGYLLG